MNQKELRAWVDTLPSNGEWWHSSGRETFVDVAKRMIAFGIAPEIVTALLERLYSAVAAEYGE